MPKEHLDKIRKQFPQYSDMSDSALASAMLKKYPEYQDVLGDMVKPKTTQQEPARTAAFKPMMNAWQGGVNQAKNTDATAESYKYTNPFAYILGKGAAVTDLVGGAGSVVDEAVKQIPVVGNAASKAMGVLPTITNNAIDILSKAIPSEIKNSPEGEMGGRLTRNVAPSLIPFLPKFLREGVAAGARVTMPHLDEHLYNTALNTSFDSFAERNAVVKRGLDEKLPVGGTYSGVERNWNKTQGMKQEIFTKNIMPKIDKLQNGGYRMKATDAADAAIQDMRENFSDLKTPTGFRLEETLQKLKEGFLKQEGKFISPKRMQEMKTAVHQIIPYDTEGQIAQAWNKAVAKQFRVRLEGWDGSLADANKKWAELNAISDAQKTEGLKSSKKLPAGVKSAPFYMAVAEPLRGAALSAGRMAFIPGIESKAAFFINSLKNAPPDALYSKKLIPLTIKGKDE